MCRPKRKLLLGNDRLELVITLRNHLSPKQMAGKFKHLIMPRFEDANVCRETIYSAIYALSIGELKKELIHCLCQRKSPRKSRPGQVDRSEQIPGMVSIHLRSPEIEKRAIPGHCLIKGKKNASVVGT